MTGAAIQALIAAGRGRNEAVEEGIAYLRDAQNPDGGFPEFPGNPESNVASTAWAVQGIWAVGREPRRLAQRLGRGDRRAPRLHGIDAAARRPHPLEAQPGSERDLDDRLLLGRPRRPCLADPGGAAVARSRRAPAGGRGRRRPGRRRRDRRRRRQGGAALQPAQTAEPGQDPRRRAGRPEPERARNHSETRRGENAEQPSGTTRDRRSQERRRRRAERVEAVAPRAGGRRLQPAARGDRER